MSKLAFEPTEDGLEIPEVGSWVETKYRLVGLYDKLFATGMKGKWGKRVYVDLYAGAGYSRIRGTNRLLAGSPFLALSVPDPFDQYIFCESSPPLLESLRKRVAKHFRSAVVEYIPGDCNEKVGEILAAIPVHSKRQTVLSFCFVDPLDIGIKFSTIRQLSNRFVDFLLLLALYMDANRNVAHYVSPSNTKVDEFLGTSDWRNRWARHQKAGVEFPEFLAREYTDQMKALNFIPPQSYEMKRVRSDDKNLPLYFLALFSRHPRAYELWIQVLKYATNQKSLFS